MPIDCGRCFGQGPCSCGNSGTIGPPTAPPEPSDRELLEELISKIDRLERQLDEIAERILRRI